MNRVEAMTSLPNSGNKAQEATQPASARLALEANRRDHDHRIDVHRR